MAELMGNGNMWPRNGNNQEIWTRLEPRLELSHGITFSAHTVIYF